MNKIELLLKFSWCLSNENKPNLTWRGKGMGGSVESIYMYSIHLTNGSWMRVLNILRDRVQGSSRHETRPRIKLTSLAGGEYEGLRERFGSRIPGGLASSLSEFYNRAMDELVTKYVAGAEVMENPFVMPSDVIEMVWRSGLREELPVT
jgi:hypothetical protein